MVNIKKGIGIVSIFTVLSVYGANMSNDMMSAHSMMQHNGASFSDKRVSLGLPQFAKNRQLANMREHLKAVNDIVKFIALGNFDKASSIAKNKLGLTDAMLKECKKFDREDFKSLGFAFHKSANKLAKVLKTKDTKQSLTALSNTLGYCVSCHDTFKQ